MAWVYILRMGNEQLYIGSTVNFEKRIKYHTLGHTATTRRLKVKEVALKQEFKTLAEARSVELKLKKLKRRDYIEKIVKEGYIKVQP